MKGKQRLDTIMAMDNIGKILLYCPECHFKVVKISMTLTGNVVVECGKCETTWLHEINTKELAEKVCHDEKVKYCGGQIGCHTYHPISEFYSSAGKPDGYATSCKKAGIKARKARAG